LNAYADTVTENLDEIAGGISLDRWVDVVSADLGRLVRHPNTRHFGVEYTDEPRYCVPVSVKELTAIDPDRYEELTSRRRQVPDDCRRNPSEEAGEKVTFSIQNAAMSGGTRSGGGSIYDSSRIRRYKSRANDAIDVEKLKLLTSNKLYIWEFREREDAFQHGNESRVMEMFIILDLVNKYQPPIDVIVDFFRPIPGFDENYTKWLVRDYIARDYGLMRMDTLADRAPTFYQE
jgi:hypothetical protein